MSQLHVHSTFRAVCLTLVGGLLLLMATLLPAEANAHLGHSGPHPGAESPPNGGRLPGQPDFVRKGETTYRFLPGKGEYEISHEGRPTAYAHVEFAAAEGFNAGPNSPLPTSEDAPICSTSGHRIVVVYTHRSGEPSAPVGQIQSIIRRMNWKIVDQSSQSSGGARPVQMVVDCTGEGAIRVHDVTTASNDLSTTKSAVTAQLYGQPFGDDSIKYLAFDSQSNASATGIGEHWVNPLKGFNNPNATQTNVAIAYKTIWETHVPVHEMFHTFGASQGGSIEPPPFATQKAHCVDGIDILCYEDGSGKTGFTETRCPASEGYDQATKTPIDCGKDTYFDAAPEAGSWLATHWNPGQEENPFLVNENDKRLTVETGNATAVTSIQATVVGKVAGNSSLGTKYRFEYGPTESYGSSMPTSFTSIATSMFNTQVKETLTGLTPGALYHYRLAAQNSKGTVYGADRTFLASRWKVQPLPSFEKNVSLFDVSCSGKGVCTAVGSESKQPEPTIALRRVDGEWVHQPTPNPSGASNSTFNGVSCASSSSCVAVGYWRMAASPFSEQALAEHWNGGSWAIETVPTPAEAKGKVELFNVSCVSANYCMAVGRARKEKSSSSQLLTVAALWNGTSWSLTSPPNPLKGGVEVHNELQSVSCTSTSNCVAVGTATGPGETKYVLIERWNGSAWSVEEPAVASGATELNDISCSAANQCMAVGLAAGKYLALAWNGTKWTETKTGESGVYNAVSCVSGSACYASTFGANGIHFWNGSAWAPEPISAVGEVTPTFKDLACWSADSCAGVGSSGKPLVEQRTLYFEPTVSTGAASGIDLTKATLNGTVNTGGDEGAYYFEYGKTTSYGSKAPVPAKSFAATAEDVQASQTIEGLTPNTTYYYRIVAFSEGGISKGVDRVFTTHDTMPIKALSFGSTGTGNGQFGFPRGIAFDASGNVWVADGNNDRVQKFNESGEYLGQFGSSGIGNGQFDIPVDIAITAGGDLWVTDALNCRVQKFDSTGKYLDQFGTCGLGGGEFVEASGIAIGPNGHIWVSDSRYYRVQEFTPEGDFVRSIGGYGVSNGEFESPSGVAVDSNGHVWVTDDYLNRVQEFSSEGEYLSQFGSYGTGPGLFAAAGPIEITPSGRIWITDRETGRVQAFNASGHYLGTFGNFFEPGGLAAGPEGSVYVSDSRNDRVQKWRLAAAPGATTLAAQEVIPTQAKLRGTVNAEGFATTYRFEYGKTTSYGTSVPVPDQSVGASVKAVEVSQTVGSLTPGTVYHYRIVAKSDGGGPVYGVDQTFETPPTPLQLAAMATTKAFDGTSASLADFAANWSTLGWASGSTPKGQDTSVGWRPVESYPTVHGAFFNPAIADTGTGVAAVATLSVRPQLADRYFSLWLDMASPGAVTRNGYELRFTETAANVYEVALNRWQAGTKTSLATKTGYSFAVGSQLALVDKGGTVSAWTKTGSEFTQLLSAEDSSFSAGNVGLEGAGTILAINNFKTGSLLSAVANMDAALKGLSVIDTFTNRSETPLSSGGAWAALAWDNGGSGKNTGQTWSGYGWVAYDSYPAINGAYWTKATMPDTGAGVGVAATLSLRFPAVSRYFSLWLDMPSPASARSGYELRFTETATGVYEVALNKWQAGTKTSLATKTGYSFAVGSQLALVDKGGTVSVWTKTSSGEFTQLLSAEDATSVSGYTGIEMSGPNYFLKDFKSGSLAPF